VLAETLSAGLDAGGAHVDEGEGVGVADHELAPAAKARSQLEDVDVRPEEGDEEVLHQRALPGLVGLAACFGVKDPGVPALLPDPRIVIGVSVR
jgi:hypothetical protein